MLICSYVTKKWSLKIQLNEKMVPNNYVNLKTHIQREEFLFLQFHSKSKFESIQNFKLQIPNLEIRIINLKSINLLTN